MHETFRFQSTLSSISAWTLSNLCRNYHLSDPAVPKILPAFGNLISNDDPKTLHCPCWDIAFLIDTPSKTIKEIVHAGLVSPLVSILNHNQGALVTPVNIKAISRLETDTEIQIGCVFTDGAMPLLANLALLILYVTTIIIS